LARCHFIEENKTSLNKKSCPNLGSFPLVPAEFNFVTHHFTSIFIGIKTTEDFENSKLYN